VSARTLGNGKYALGEALGRGGSARVFRARRFPDAQAVAAKLIPLHEVDEPVALLARYQHIAQLEHPHILPILDVGISEDVLFVISPLASGGDLRQLVQRDQLEPHAVLGLVGQIADALQYVHRRGLTHLDVKPANILLATRSHPLLGDFGLTQPAPGPSGRPRVRGTPAYMAPEQCTLGPLGPATDQYALGVTTFELLTGRKPFVGGSAQDMLRRQVCESPPSPTSVNPGLPCDVDGVLLRALAKAPQHRYPDVAAFVVALTNALAHAPRVPPPRGVPTTADRTLDAMTLELLPSASRQRL
jgi:eukaryotic-like serine/threonine-protein kinase